MDKRKIEQMVVLAWRPEAFYDLPIYPLARPDASGEPIVRFLTDAGYQCTIKITHDERATGTLTFKRGSWIKNYRFSRLDKAVEFILEFCKE